MRLGQCVDITRTGAVTTAATMIAITMTGATIIVTTNASVRA
jgi:pseudouridine-5'-phosphate glycosidase